MNLILFAIDPSELGTAQRPPEILETQTGDAFVAGLTGFGIIILWIAIVLVCLAIHFIPTIIAAIRRHHNTVPVFLVNLFFGWSFIGWVVALIWACTTPPVTKVVIVGDDRM